jgi:hypothetical protein
VITAAILFGNAVVTWWSVGFGNLNYESTMRWVVPGCCLMALGFETILAGFFLGILDFFRR